MNTYDLAAAASSSEGCYPDLPDSVGDTKETTRDSRSWCVPVLVVVNCGLTGVTWSSLFTSPMLMSGKLVNSCFTTNREENDKLPVSVTQRPGKSLQDAQEYIRLISELLAENNQTTDRLANSHQLFFIVFHLPRKIQWLFSIPQSPTRSASCTCWLHSHQLLRPLHVKHRHQWPGGYRKEWGSSAPQSQLQSHQNTQQWFSNSLPPHADWKYW